MEEKESSASSTIFNISLEKFKDLVDLKVSLDELYILEQFSLGRNVHSIQGVRIQAIIQTLERKGWLLPGDLISVSGTSILTYTKASASMKELLAEDRIKQESAFEKWWKAYPATDIFEHKGKKFIGSRGFRTKKEECRTKFNKILDEGDYSEADLIRALEYEVMIKKETSVKEGENKMRYMQSTLPYLNQRTFENFVDISKQPIKPSTGSGTDI